MREDLHEANRRSWNAATAAHGRHKGDQAAFFREGGSTLFPEEVELLGDVRGRSLLHLQCNAGQDTLSLARPGARVTGVDISDEAIRSARELSAASGIAADFHRADVYPWLSRARDEGRGFDVAFCSYGALPWLSDLSAWARGIAGVLHPGGRFVCVEFHPFALAFDAEWQHRNDYFGGSGPIQEATGVGDYVADSEGALSPGGAGADAAGFHNPHPSYEFQWPLGEVVTALLDAGLVLTALREYPYMNGWKAFSRMRPLPGRRWAPPEDVPGTPLMFGIAARRP